MAESIQLKSRVREFYDFRNVDISEFVKGFVTDEQQLEKDLNRILKAHGRKEAAEIVSEGDTVTLDCRSENPRFNKTNLPVIIGRGLFDRELEQQLSGARVGEALTLLKNGTPVEITVTKCVHTVLPELSDENVAAFGIEGVCTVSDLRRSCIAKQIDGFLLEDENPDMASAHVWQEVARRVRIERDPEEEAHARARAAKKLSEMQNAEPVETDEEADEGSEPAGEIPADFLENMFLSELDLAVVGEEMMRSEGRCVTSDDYKAYLGKLKEAYPNRTEEEIRKENDPETFAISEYANYLASEIDRYVADCYKTTYAKE